MPDRARPFQWLARRAADTERLGRLFGETAPDGAVLLLEGPLGAGKTTFAHGVAAGCGVEGPVASPTYNLILHYQGRRPFTHADLFRLSDAAELESLDLAEVLSPPGVACVEWPALLARQVEPPYATVEIARQGTARRIMVYLLGRGWEPLARALGGES